MVLFLIRKIDPLNLFKNLAYQYGFPRSSVSKESACDAEDWGSVPGCERSPEEGNSNPLQYPYLENPMD